ncbi:pentapeptide repeat-containing protein [Amycolatopsis sp. NPDC058986]|uniref:pentapeptide repeat-containing protein n=1 Tax=unclassified Amycolatopsis TaxID=2618356 RepID=UPI00366F9763
MNRMNGRVARWWHGREGTWWWSIVVIVLPVAAVAAAAVTALLAFVGDDGQPGEQARNRIELIRTGLTVGAGAAGVVALVLNGRRQWSTEHDARERRLTELYVKAVEQLGSGEAAVRHGGLHALERVAKDNPAHRQTVVNVLCAYLRAPYALPGGERSRPRRGIRRPLAPSSPRQAAPPRSVLRDDVQQEREVRLTAQRILTAHLRPTDDHGHPLSAFWADVDLNLTGATLIDFDLAGSRLGTAIFTGAEFVGGAGFDGVTFTGDARFDAAVFPVNTGFGGATFAGYAGFAGASFAGDARFGGARFSGNTAFDGASFAGDVRFGRATFAGHAAFDGASFAGYAGFVRTRFVAYTGFGTTSFAGHAVFDNATFAGYTVFDGATFAGDAGFGGATFAGDALFDTAGFAGDARFGRASFAGNVRFADATFGGAADFTDTKFRRGVPEPAKALAPPETGGVRGTGPDGRPGSSR